MTAWRELHRQLPQFTYLADIEAYADVFDAIDEARERGRGYSADPVLSVRDRRKWGQLAAHFAISVTPVTQVRTANTVRLCIGLLQDSVWRDAERWHLRVAARPGPSVLLPNVSRLLARKLLPTPSEIADVARFILMPSPGLSQGEESYGEPFAPALRFVERHMTTPAPAPVRAALIEARRRLAIVWARALGIRHTSGGKPHTSRFDKWDVRLARLLEGP